MVDFADPEDLRRRDSNGHQDLREWRFRDKWSHDDTSTVLAWAGGHGCVFHEMSCGHQPKDEPDAKCRMDRVRETFDAERDKGVHRYFGFCGHCLAERTVDFGKKMSERRIEQYETVHDMLNDVRVLGLPRTTKKQLIARMRSYPCGAPTMRELKLILDYYAHVRGDEEDDLTAYLSD